MKISMRKLLNKSKLALLALFVLLASPAEAGPSLMTSYKGGGLGKLLENVAKFFTSILVPFFLAIAFMMMVWGVVQYFVIGGANDDARAKGKSLIIYSLAAFIIVIVFWGVVNLLTSSTGLEGKDIDGNLPKPVPFSMVIKNYV